MLNDTTTAENVLQSHTTSQKVRTITTVTPHYIGGKSMGEAFEQALSIEPLVQKSESVAENGN